MTTGLLAPLSRPLCGEITFLPGLGAHSGGVLRDLPLDVVRRLEGAPHAERLPFRTPTISGPVHILSVVWMHMAGYGLGRGVHRLCTWAVMGPTHILVGALLVAARRVVPSEIRRLEALRQEWAHVSLTEASGPQVVSSENEKRDAKRKIILRL